MAVAQDEKQQQPDPRLQETRLTLSVARVTLEELLKQATEQTKIQMSADPESKAWKVRELPVSIVCKDMTAAAFQQHLSSLLDLRWMRSGKAPDYVYVLWQDRNARLREAKTLENATTEETAKAVEQWASLADAYANASLEQSKDEVFREFAQNNDFGRSYTGLIGALAGPGASALAGGEPFRAGFNDLGPKSRADLRTYATSVAQFAKMMDPDFKTPSNIDFSKVTVGLMPVPQGPWHQQMNQLGFIGMIQLAGGGLDDITLPVVTPGSPVGSMMAEASLRIAKGEHPRQVMEESMSKMQAAMTGGAYGKRAEEPASDAVAADPRLDKEVELKSGNVQDLVDALKPISEATGVALVGEGWSLRGFTMPSMKAPAREVLDRVCKLVDCEWKSSGSAVRLKAKDWAQRRSAMVSRAARTRWSDLAADSPEGFTLDQMVEFVTEFSKDQINTIMSEESGMGRYVVTSTFPSAREGLLFYGALDSGGVASLSSERGIAALDLTSSERIAMDELLSRQGISPEQFYRPGANVKLVKGNSSTSLSITYPGSDPKTVRIHRTFPAAEGAQAPSKPAQPEAK